SIVPNCTRNLVRLVTPERGRTCASVPGGSLTAIPVGTTVVSPGSIITSLAAYKSKPESVACARVGSVAFSFNRLNPTVNLSVIVRSPLLLIREILPEYQHLSAKYLLPN